MLNTSQVLRRQFVLTQYGITPFEGWKTVKCGHYSIYFHPDLTVIQHRHEGAVATLIGYAIDPAEPLATDQQIVARLAGNAATIDEALNAAMSLGGRWALLIETRSFDILLHDACGLRQVFYSEPGQPFFCASQAVTAARLFELERSSDGREFIDLPFVQTNPEYWWPGDATQFCGVRCLLPNHYLDLRTRRSVRYAPRHAMLGRMSVEEAIDAAVPILANLIRGAAERYRLALPITAGWDSRLLLAACRHSNLAPYCYTLKMRHLNSAHQDIAIPGRLSRGMGMHHHVIDCPPETPAQFSTLYKQNTDPAHDEACSIAWGLSQAYPSNFVSLSGHCSEIARCFYHPTPVDGHVTGRTLAQLTGMDASPFVLKQFDDWIVKAREAANGGEIDLLDLFYWEQRAGRWAANGQAQWDLVHERFTALNCRQLLVTLLSADLRYRRPPYFLYRQLVSRLAPEVLSEPINPDSQPSFWRRGARMLKKGLRTIFET